MSNLCQFPQEWWEKEIEQQGIRIKMLIQRVRTRDERIAELEAVRVAAADYMEHQWDELGDNSFDRLEQALKEAK